VVDLRLPLSWSNRSFISGNTHWPPGNFLTTVFTLTPASIARVVLLHLNPRPTTTVWPLSILSRASSSFSRVLAGRAAW
jgi:hypothetical protein